MPTVYGIQSAGAVLTVIHTFRPNLINEFTAGVTTSAATASAGPNPSLIISPA